MSENEDSVARFKRQVAEEWGNPVVSAGYRKWSREEAEWGRAAGELMVQRLRLAPGMKVLDVGSAHGEPGLAVARAVGVDRHVTLTDIAPALLELAAERARDEGLTNVDTRVVDAHELPFPGDTFDRLSGRFVAMYFADQQQAFKQALRVLKPGGMAVYLVWGALEQPIFSEVLGALFRYVPPPEPEPGAPSPFVFCETGTLASALRTAGFVDVEEENATIGTTFPGSPEQWWEWMSDGAAPIQTWMASLSTGDRQRAVADIHSVLYRYHDGEGVRMPINVNVACAAKAGRDSQMPDT
jgi:ubiquinone/menaquinone biosynthesis C-methylase UbiE